MRGSLEPGWSRPALGMPPRPFLKTTGKGLQGMPYILQLLFIAAISVQSPYHLPLFGRLISLAGEGLRRMPGWSCQDLGLALRSFCPRRDSLSDPLRVPAFWVPIVSEQMHRSKQPGNREIISLCQKQKHFPQSQKELICWIYVLVKLWCKW